MGATIVPAADRRTYLWLVLVFAMVFPTAAAWGYFLALAGAHDASNPVQQLAYPASKVIQFGFPVLVLVLGGVPWPRLLRPNRAGMGIGLAFGLLVAGLMLGAYFGFLRQSRLLAATPRQLQTKLEQFDMATPARYAALAGFIVVGHSLLEEYYWRWFVFGGLRRLVARGPAIALSSLAFMAHHVVVLHVYLPGKFWTAVVPFSLAIAVGGAFWAWLYDRAGTLYPSWLSHLLVDAAIFAIGWDLLLRAPGP